MKAKKLEALQEFSWVTQSQFSTVVNKGNMRLGVVITLLQNRWNVAAIETPLGITDLEGVFDNHSHKIVGAYESPTDAFVAAEGFARAWLKGFKSTRSSPCDCKEMSSGGGGPRGKRSLHP